MKKFAILVNSLTAGGAENVVKTLAEEFTNKHYEVHLICIEKNNFYNVNDNVFVKYLIEGKETSNVVFKIFNLILLSFKLAVYLKRNNINYVQSHLFRSNYINILSKLFYQHKAHIVNHGIATDYGYLNILMMKLLYRFGDTIITISQMMKYNLEQIIFNKNIIIINNPYNIQMIENLSSMKIDFKFKSDKFYLVVVGRLIKLKRHIDILTVLNKLDSSIELIIVGDGDEKLNLKNFVQTNNLDSRVHFIGFVNNPYPYLKNSHLCILSSESEGFPNVLIEAMVCGVPIISTDCISGPREILAPDTNIQIQLKNTIEIAEYGVLTPIMNSDKLEEAIMLLINNYNLREQFIKKGFERANNFNMEKIIKQYEELICVE